MKPPKIDQRAAIFLWWFEVFLCVAAAVGWAAFLIFLAAVESN